MNTKCGVRRHTLAVVAAGALYIGVHAVVAAETAATSAPVVELRYRYENVDDAAFPLTANANTLRLRLGYRWVFAPSWQVYADGMHVQALFGDRYNSTANGKTQYPTVADPKADAISQFYVACTDDTMGGTLGRQRVILDNQRFFGNSGWRQNEQTFDALSTRFALGDGAPVVRYLYLDRVLRVFGHENPNPLLRDWDLTGHLVNISQPLPLGSLTGYGYWVENHDIATLSARTLGVRWTGTHPVGDSALAWTLEYADQSDWSNNPINQGATYRLFEPKLVWRGTTFKAGWEVLGGDGNYGFSTPYATLHAFNGWADRFLTTPKSGLRDVYAGAEGVIGRTAWAVVVHDFRADESDSHYGKEFDASLGYTLNTHWNGLLKFADYRSSGFATDERKIWISLEYRY